MEDMASCVYYGTTLLEAEKIVSGDYSALSLNSSSFYKKVHLKLNPAVGMAHRAIGDDADEPAIVELLIKDQSHDARTRTRIKSARIVSEAELLKRTGYSFDRGNVNGLPTGVVIRSSNQIYTVQCETGCHQCTLCGKWKTVSGGIDPVAVGDRVKVRVIDEKTGVIQAVMRRKNQYGRDRSKKSPHIIAANLDGLIIVSAVKEPPIWQRLLDKYLVIAEASGISPLICINKIDLVDDRRPTLALLSVYKGIGYEALMTSAVTGEGIAHLRQWMKDKISAVAGLSCVGKSALLNAIQPGLQLRTGAYNEKRREGRHTTVATELLKLDMGGFVADTPGIRALSFLDVDARMMDGYFPEMRRPRQMCEKNPCTHLHEAGCAVKNALQEGRIAKSRYESYREFRREADH